jgi:uncharacterized protein (TIGR00730 family)
MRAAVIEAKAPGWRREPSSPGPLPSPVTCGPFSGSSMWRVELSRICVYCGSSAGAVPDFAAAARSLGELLARSGITLVYGGAAVGLMGVLADAALSAGGEVVGVIPRHLFGREIAHPGLTKLIEVDSMHERKLKMFELADAFVALPGGLGTVEELTEMATWSQLGMHGKPIATVDIGGYWTGFHAFLGQAVGHGFMKPENLRLIVNVGTVGEVLPALRAYSPPRVGKWIGVDDA